MPWVVNATPTDFSQHCTRTLSSYQRGGVLGEDNLRQLDEDLFHPKVPRAFIEQVFETMEACPHVFQILTKRSQRMRKLAPQLNWPSASRIPPIAARRPPL
jgi:hypothetical protein